MDSRLLLFECDSPTLRSNSTSPVNVSVMGLGNVFFYVAVTLALVSASTCSGASTIASRCLDGTPD